MGIKPIFVFDGSPPGIKSETSRKRREKRQEAQKDKEDAKAKLFQNLLKMHALKGSVSKSLINLSDAHKY